jgi:thiamine biosynthesis lipoprotein
MRRRGLDVHRFGHEAMTTSFEILIAGKTRTYAGQAAAAAFAEIDRIERLFNRFDPSSEVSRINRLAAGESMMIGVETLECLSLAAELQPETRGAFDVNYRGRRPAPGGRERGAVPTPAERSILSSGDRDKGATTVRGSRPRTPAAPRLQECIDLRAVRGGFEVRRPPRRGRLRPPPLDLDLGAIGKGYALDCALDVLGDWGIGNVLMHSGTSTALAAGPGPDGGKEAGKGWAVGVASAWPCPEFAGTVRLFGRAVSGSGTDVKGDHIVDPRSGLPARRRTPAWASHTSAAVSDALSTAFLVMTPAEVRAFCARHLDVWALVILGPKKCKIFNSDVMRTTHPEGDHDETDD